MKNLQFFSILMLLFLSISCSKEEETDNSETNQSLQGDQSFEAVIDGSTFSNYQFVLGTYQITKGTSTNTLSIDVSDENGEMITLFLNQTGGFSSNTVKTTGDIDSNNFMTYILIRQSQPQLSYYSSSDSGTITITNNKEHPSKSGYRLISGNFNVTADSTQDNYSTEMSGSFTDLEYED